jgi:uncharacterized protein with predicted RNA binding PUA domain
MAATGIEQLRTVADYQFGAGAGVALFPPEEGRTIRRSTTGRPQQVLASEGRIVSYGVDGRLTLGIEGGYRLTEAFPAPQCRVSVGPESVPFVSEGKNAFCKFVREVGPEIRPGDEVLVVLDGNASEGKKRREGGKGDGGSAKRNGSGERNGSEKRDRSEERNGSEARAVEPGALVAVGRAELAADAVCDFETGMAVKVRAGVGTPG